MGFLHSIGLVPEAGLAPHTFSGIPWESSGRCVQFFSDLCWSLLRTPMVKRLPSGYSTLPWKIPYKWRFIAGKIIYKWAIYTMAMSNNKRVIVIFKQKTSDEMVIPKPLFFSQKGLGHGSSAAKPILMQTSWSHGHGCFFPQTNMAILPRPYVFCFSQS